MHKNVTKKKLRVSRKEETIASTKQIKHLKILTDHPKRQVLLLKYPIFIIVF